MQNAAVFFCLMVGAPCLSLAQTADASLDSSPAQLTPAPLTQSERLHEYLKDLRIPVTLAASAVGAGIGQWRDVPSEWGQDGGGFARRLGSAYGRHVAYSTMLFGASSLLHEDNRYVPSGQSRFGGRLKYALASTVLARHDDPEGGSRRRLSISRIGALAGAAFLSRTWQPSSTSSPQSGAVSFGVSLGIAAGFNVAREFLPSWMHLIK